MNNLVQRPKTALRLGALFCAIVLLIAACGSDAGVDETVEPDSSTDEQSGDQEAGERIETLWVGPQLVDCVGAFPQTCMQVRQSEDGQVEYFYDQIEGFEHQAGTSYVLSVAVSNVENPPADASSLRYRLVEVVESTTESASDQIEGTSWTLRGFRDGDLFDPVPAEVEITINFADGQVSGSAGCNNYMGSYAAEADSLTFGPLAGTKMLCPPDVMQYEDRFHAVMADVSSAEVTFDGALVLAPTAGLQLVFGPA